VQLYRAFLPAAKNDSAHLYSMEPYAYAQFITGKDHPYKFGRARNSWLTGTATWAFVALSQHILGVRAGYDGLVIEPAVPKDWPKYRVTRGYRGATYEIRVEGAGKVREVYVDGKSLPHEGGKAAVIPVAAAGTVVDVRVVC
jgi:N,N'-diacetylchitobiose phosphorylase